MELIERDNLRWRDLAEDLGFEPLEPTVSPLSREMTKKEVGFRLRRPLSTRCGHSARPFNNDACLALAFAFIR